MTNPPLRRDVLWPKSWVSTFFGRISRSQVTKRTKLQFAPMGKHVRRGLGREQPQSKWWDPAEDSRMRVVAQIMGVKILWSIRVFRHPTIKTAVWPFWGRLASGSPVTENRGSRFSRIHAHHKSKLVFACMGQHARWEPNRVTHIASEHLPSGELSRSLG